MVIECAACRSRFNLDESLLRSEGSKVRCSICRNIFTAYPPEPDFPTAKGSLRMELEETVALDSPPTLAERGEPPDEDFEKSFQEALDEEVPASASLDRGTAEGPFPEIQGTMGEGNMGMAEMGLDGDLTTDEKPATPPEVKRALRPQSVILLLLLVIIGGSAAVYLFAPGILPAGLSFLKPAQREEIADMGVARLSFSNVKGDFVRSEKAGQLFVIQGLVTNNYPKGRSFILLKGSLLDDKGQVVRTKMAYAGNAFTDEQIKTMSIEEIDAELKNRMGRQNANARVTPESQIPFFIIIENLPENLSEFTVEAVSSSPEQP